MITSPRRQLIVALLSAVVVGALAGAVWAQLAEPGTWRVQDGQLLMGQEESRAEFGVMVLFAVVGVVASLLWAAAVTAVSRPGGGTVALVVLGSVLAAVVAWRVGVLLGPGDPQAVSGLSDGDTVPDQLSISAVAPFVLWPAAGMAGLLLGSLFVRDDDHDDRATAATSAPVTAIND